MYIREVQEPGEGKSNLVVSGIWGPEREAARGYQSWKRQVTRQVLQVTRRTSPDPEQGSTHTAKLAPAVCAF